MPTQAEINAGRDQASKDTAAAKARQGNNGRTEKDTEAARNRTAKDTAAAKARQKGGGGSSEMDERERAAGLYLTGGDSMDRREFQRGLYDTTTGREKGKRNFNDVTRSGEYQRRIDAAAEAEQVGTKQGNIDFTSASTTASSGGGSLAGIEIIWADQTETFITEADILDDYDGENYWSVVFAVSGGAFTKATPTYDATQELWDDVGTAQTKYRLRVKTLNTVPDPSVPTQLSAYGQYREEILCVNGDPVVNLIKIS